METTGWGTRHTLTLLGFFGFAILYAMRFNLSIAIVSMVKPQPVNEMQLNHFNNASHFQDLYCPVSQHLEFLNFSSVILSPQNGHTTAPVLQKTSGKTAGFSWTEEEQGLIMGSFFWGYVITQYPGGHLSHKYGAKWIISMGVLFTGMLSLATPVVTNAWGKYGLITIRILQGLGEGVAYPAMHCMLAQWTPPEERSRMTNLIFSGMAMGTGATLVIGGYLIHYLGWPSLFYSVGILSIIWFIFWTLFIFSSPSEHPRISMEELEYIVATKELPDLREGVKDRPTPWEDIVRSVPVWTIFIVHLGQSWCHYFLHTEVPKYLHSVQNFKIQHTGWFSALPQFLNGFFGIFTSYVSDFLIARKITSIVFTRKLCNTIALWGSALAFLGVILGGCNTLVSVIFLNIGGAVLGAGHGGWVVNNIDIAPNYAGTIMGICNAVSNSLGFLAPYVTGLILSSDPSLHGWRIAFAIPAVTNFLVNIIFLVFASAKEQPWNRPRPTVVTL